MLETLAHDTNIWVVFSFVIFAVIIIKATKSALTSVVDSRIAHIKKELQEAENLHTEAQELLAQYQRKHANAVEEAKTIITNAETYATKIRKQAKKELKQNIERRETQLAERINRMKENAIVEIQRYAADIAIEATREIIIKDFDKKRDQALLGESIKDLNKHLH